MSLLPVCCRVVVLSACAGARTCVRGGACDLRTRLHLLSHRRHHSPITCTRRPAPPLWSWVPITLQKEKESMTYHSHSPILIEFGSENLMSHAVSFRILSLARALSFSLSLGKEAWASILEEKETCHKGKRDLLCIVVACAHTRGGQDTETRAARAEACKTFMAGLFHARALKLVCRGLARQHVFSSLDSPRERACSWLSCTHTHTHPCSWLSCTHTHTHTLTHTHTCTCTYTYTHIQQGQDLGAEVPGRVSPDVCVLVYTRASSAICVLTYWL